MHYGSKVRYFFKSLTVIFVILRSGRKYSHTNSYNFAMTLTPFAVYLRKMYIHLRQQLKLCGKYTFISTSMKFINAKELSITLFAYVLTFNSINGWTIAPLDNQTVQTYFQSQSPTETASSKKTNNPWPYIGKNTWRYVVSCKIGKATPSWTKTALMSCKKESTMPTGSCPML